MVAAREVGLDESSYRLQEVALTVEVMVVAAQALISHRSAGDVHPIAVMNLVLRHVVRYIRYPDVLNDHLKVRDIRPRPSA
mmetsp:Transcript_148264/g.210572  ORF Transcript_148264/g.210572 Transcript_148264/m.210572 type:complete len:81 (-) Transcript_148264:55-297(-)